MNDIVEVLRVVRYRGSRAWVEWVLKQSITGTKKFSHRTNGEILFGEITSVTLDEFPRVLEEPNEHGS